jgi:hypothetical protein
VDIGGASRPAGGRGEAGRIGTHGPRRAVGEVVCKERDAVVVKRETALEIPQPRGVGGGDRSLQRAGGEDNRTRE